MNEPIIYKVDEDTYNSGRSTDSLRFYKSRLQGMRFFSMLDTIGRLINSTKNTIISWLKMSIKLKNSLDKLMQKNFTSAKISLA